MLRLGQSRSLLRNVQKYMRMSTNYPNQSAVHLKRHAYHQTLRRQHIEQRFQTFRLAFQPPSNHFTSQIIDCIPNLPQSLYSLRQIMHFLAPNELRALAMSFLQNIVPFHKALSQLSITLWLHYVDIVNRFLLVLQNEDVCELLTQAKRVVLHGAVVQMKVHKIMSDDILNAANQFIFRMGKQVINCNQIELQQLSEILAECIYRSECLAESEEQEREKGREQYATCLASINNLVSYRIAEQDQQNIHPPVLLQIEGSKLLFLQQLFFRKVAPLRIIVSTCFRLQSENALERKTLLLSLKILLNMTYFLKEEHYFSTLLDLHVITLINMVLFVYGNLRFQLTFLAIRLVNNLLLISKPITAFVTKELLFPKLVQLFHESNQQLKQQIIDLGSNAVLYMNDDEEVVRKYYSFFAQIFWEALTLQFLEEQCIETVLNVLLIFLDHECFTIQSVRGNPQYMNAFEFARGQSEAVDTIVTTLLNTHLASSQEQFDHISRI